MPSKALGAMVCSSQCDKSSLTRPGTVLNAWLSSFWMGLLAKMRSRRKGMSWNVPEGTAVSRLCDRSSSMRFVRPRKARSSIWPMRQLRRKTRCRFRRPARTKVSRGRIWMLLPERSSTWVAESTPSGIVISERSVHSTVCLPPFHLHVHADGQFPPIPALFSTSTVTTRIRSAFRFLLALIVHQTSNLSIKLPVGVTSLID